MGLYPLRNDKPRMNCAKVRRWDAHERSLAYETANIFATVIRRMSRERDHIASSSFFQEHQSSRSMIRKCRKSRLPRECQSPIIPYVFLSHVLNHILAQLRVTIVTRREDYLQSSISHGIRSMDLASALWFYSRYFATFSLMTNRSTFTFICTYRNDQAYKSH